MEETGRDVVAYYRSYLQSGSLRDRLSETLQFRWTNLTSWQNTDPFAGYPGRAEDEALQEGIASLYQQFGLPVDSPHPIKPLDQPFHAAAAQDFPRFNLAAYTRTDQTGVSEDDSVLRISKLLYHFLPTSNPDGTDDHGKSGLYNTAIELMVAQVCHELVKACTEVRRPLNVPLAANYLPDIFGDSH
jgi:hypothetical protein